jgi:hypothetical protein
MDCQNEAGLSPMLLAQVVPEEHSVIAHGQQADGEPRLRIL